MPLPLGDMLFHMYLSDRVDWQTCHQFGEHERIEPMQRMGPLAHGHKNKKWKQMGLLDLTRRASISLLRTSFPEFLPLCSQVTLFSNGFNES